ncbi:MAG: AmmeMemoRadiSam system protein A [Treponema sp. CETP13]|nr:MAG: AmmeMemoRadiSam system protein A [Treponema sp. CETP13]
MHYPQSLQPKLALKTIMESLSVNYPFADKSYEFDKLKNLKAACFVSLHIDKNGDKQLRGCIGTLSPVTDSLFDEICDNARSAAFHDPRFLPLQKNELENLTISVDVLAPFEHIESKKQLDPKIYGVIVQNGTRRGVLLPDLDGVDDVDTQISIACRKAGISSDEEITLYRFKVVRYY